MEVPKFRPESDDPAGEGAAPGRAHAIVYAVSHAITLASMESEDKSLAGAARKA